MQLYIILIINLSLVNGLIPPIRICLWIPLPKCAPYGLCKTTEWESLLCYIWSSLSWCFWFWNFSIVRSLYIAQFASFQVSGHLISMDFVLIMTTTKSMPSRDILVHRHGPATGVMPVFIPLMPLWPSIAWVLYHLYVFLLLIKSLFVERVVISF